MCRLVRLVLHPGLHGDLLPHPLDTAGQGRRTRTPPSRLRSCARRHPQDTCTAEMVGEPAMKREYFRRRWADRKVLDRPFEHKPCRHPVVGSLTIDHQAFTSPGDEVQTRFLPCPPTSGLPRTGLPATPIGAHHEQRPLPPTAGTGDRRLRRHRLRTRPALRP
ncbi:hypothetical protein ACFY6U_02325 [Streptomyces sp. NPDC013157]|uniref:MmyB family transcriptional regulator n=1 Tax=Streptomyces sp. NPDC013157 TaxID=3364861 RepID=UPI0036CBD95A